MKTYDIQFYSIGESSRVPYVVKGDTVVYNCDGKEGSIEFDGYYYVESGPPPYPEDSDPTIKPWDKPRRYSEWLPQKVMINVLQRDKEPYRTETFENSWNEYYTEYLREFYTIEIYNKEVYESTDVISEIDDDGEPMHICFFPTNKMKLWFRVIEDMSIYPRTNFYRMATLYATKESYSRILEWGVNTSEEWYHPVSRSQFQRLSSVKQGDIIEFVLDGLSKGVQVLEIGNIYDYYLLKHTNGDFKVGFLVDRVIRVALIKRV